MSACREASDLSKDVLATQRRTLRILIAAQVVGGIGIGAGASTSAILAEAVMKTESLAGIARTSSELGGALVAIPLAMLAAKRGRREALTIGWLGAALGGLLLVVAAVRASGLLLVLGFLLFGIGKAVNLQSRYAATDLAHPSRQASDLSLVLWSTTIGAVLGPNLIAPGTAIGSRLGIPGVGGAYLFAAAATLAGAALTFARLRPDPLLLRRASFSEPAASTETPTRPAAVPNMRSTFRTTMRLPGPRLGFWSVALGQTAMAALMTMTPVHMDHLDISLGIIGLTISAHVFGMYGLSPIVGRLSDRVGAARVIWLGQGIFLAAALLAGVLRESVTAMMVALFLLGLGWSCALIAGSSLMAATAPNDIRVPLQGLSDMTMSLCGALASGFSGVVMWWSGYAGLNVLVALLTVPIIVLLLRTRTLGSAPNRNSQSRVGHGADNPLSERGSG